MAWKHSWIDDHDTWRIAGNILWRGKPGNETFHGKDGNDTISGFTGNDKLYGGAGDDGLYGQKDNDKLYGEAGRDKLDGDVGNDVLKGGTEADTFVFSTRYDKDKILDFEAADMFNHDMIDLSGLKSIDDYDDLVTNHMSMARNGKDVIIDGGGGDILTIKGVTLDDLDASHFLIF